MYRLYLIQVFCGNHPISVKLLLKHPLETQHRYVVELLFGILIAWQELVIVASSLDPF